LLDREMAEVVGNKSSLHFENIIDSFGTTLSPAQKQTEVLSCVECLSGIYKLDQ